MLTERELPSQKAFSHKTKCKSLSRVRLFVTHGLFSPRDSPGQSTGVGSLSLLQGIFPTQGSNPGLSHCRWILYELSHKGSPRILEWVAYLSPAYLPDPGIEPGYPALQVDSLPIELSGKDTPIFPYCDNMASENRNTVALYYLQRIGSRGP